MLGSAEETRITPRCLVPGFPICSVASSLCRLSLSVMFRPKSPPALPIHHHIHAGGNILSILVLGIGNLIMSDDGIGVRVVQRLSACFRFPAGVTMLDGGTLGLDLLPQLEGVESLLVVDAVDIGKAPGTLARLSGDDVPIVLETKVSPHQMGLKDLLAVAMLQGFAPHEMVLWGVQPEKIEMGLDLSPAVAEALDPLTENVLTELVSWGITAEPRQGAHTFVPAGCIPGTF